MFIRKVKKRNGVSKKIYEYLHLVESIRTEAGPRQKLILNLGRLDIPESQYEILAHRIEDLLTGQNNLLPVDDNLESIAKQAVNRISDKQSEDLDTSKSNYAHVDTNSFVLGRSRSIGAEYVCHSIWQELGLDTFLKSHHIKKSRRIVMESLVLGRLMSPGSEHHIHKWATERSGLYELIGIPERGSLTSFYRQTDELYKLQDELEKYLSVKEQELYSQSTKYCLIDLTNTYYEGQALKNPKAQYGRSKEKRKDCKLVTLGLVINEEGFVKTSDTFAGNVSEPSTLESILETLRTRTEATTEKQTVIMDGGLSTKQNIKWLKNKGYNYIVINRGKAPFDYDFEDMTTIKKDSVKDIEIKVKRYSTEEETYLLCQSKRKSLKEKSMRDRIENIFISKLEYYKSGLKKKGRIKSYSKMLEVIGRLKEKYSKIAKLYSIEVEPEESTKGVKHLQTKDITWRKLSIYESVLEGEGSYILKTNRDDLSDKEIWDTYIMLRKIEHSFLNMKSDLGLRPNYHQLETRSDSHLFISVLAYRILHIIEHKLQKQNDTRSWDTIRDILSTHQRVTLTYQQKSENGIIFKEEQRITTNPEESHKDIYRKLGLKNISIPRKILREKE